MITALLSAQLTILGQRYEAEFATVPRFVSTAHREVWLEERDKLAGFLDQMQWPRSDK